ncbi:hypothetical protein B6U93_02960 [Candidatus Woesearchaeota archaeon ex4484_78]|nr:MAG: hypothetical protein B6U93_02960 [Candidatus Woesearchaeota archaeon ex4484_78]
MHATNFVTLKLIMQNFAGVAFDKAQIIFFEEIEKEGWETTLNKIFGKKVSLRSTKDFIDFLEKEKKEKEKEKREPKKKLLNWFVDEIETFAEKQINENAEGVENELIESLINRLLRAKEAGLSKAEKELKEYFNKISYDEFGMPLDIKDILDKAKKEKKNEIMSFLLGTDYSSLTDQQKSNKLKSAYSYYLFTVNPLTNFQRNQGIFIGNWKISILNKENKVSEAPLSEISKRIIETAEELLPQVSNEIKEKFEHLRTPIDMVLASHLYGLLNLGDALKDVIEKTGISLDDYKRAVLLHDLGKLKDPITEAFFSLENLKDRNAKLHDLLRNNEQNILEKLRILGLDISDLDKFEKEHKEINFEGTFYEEIIKKHVNNVNELIEGQRISEQVRNMVLGHHYLQGYAMKEVKMVSPMALLNLLDIFESFRMRSGMSTEKALEILKGIIKGIKNPKDKEIYDSLIKDIEQKLVEEKAKKEFKGFTRLEGKERGKIADDIYDLYCETYSDLGLKIKSKEELLEKYPVWFVSYDEKGKPNAFMIGEQTENGFKLGLISQEKNEKQLVSLIRTMSDKTAFYGDVCS